MDAVWARVQVVRFVIGHAGLLPAKVAERIRDLGSYALGAGSASLPLERSGEVRLLQRLAAEWKGNVTLVDVGAHTGSWAQAAQNAFGERARLCCFEPNPASYELLESRVGAEPMVECHRLALGDEPGMARLFTNQPASPLSSLHADSFDIRGSIEGHDVRVDTLDRVADRFRIEQIDMLKLDVEGHELAVLRGARALLDRGAIRMVQFEFGERNLASRTYLRDILDLLAGYETFRLTPRGLRRLDYRPADEAFLLEANYAAIRQQWA